MPVTVYCMPAACQRQPLLHCVPDGSLHVRLLADFNSCTAVFAEPSMDTQLTLIPAQQCLLNQA